MMIVQQNPWIHMDSIHMSIYYLPHLDHISFADSRQNNYNSYFSHIPMIFIALNNWNDEKETKHYSTMRFVVYIKTNCHQEFII